MRWASSCCRRRRWAALCRAINTHRPPAVSRRLFWALVVAQVVALVRLLWHPISIGTAPPPTWRAAGPHAVLAIDVIAVTYLFSCSRRNFVWFLLGQAGGALAYTAIHGPMFGDMWKFGIGAPITYAVFLLAPFGGALFSALAATTLGLAHLNLDYRSMASCCRGCS